MGQGKAFLLKVGDGGTPPSFATVAGLRTTREEWTKGKLLIAGTGIFTGSSAEVRLKSNALTGLMDDYELCFEDGRSVSGRMLITRLDYAGDQNGERNYSIALEGEVREHA